MSSAVLDQIQPGVVQLDDAGHQAVDPDRHDEGNAGHDDHLAAQRCVFDRAQGNDDNFGGKNKVGANRALDFLLLKGCQIHIGVTQRLYFFPALILSAGTVQKRMHQFFKSLITEKGPTQHQEWGDQCGRQSTDRQRRRHQYQLILEGSFGHPPYHGQFTLRPNPRHLLGIEGQVIPQHPSGFLGGYLGHDGNVIKQGGDIVDQG